MTATAFGAARFVGRDREQAEFRGWLTEAQAGSGRMTVLRGEAGMGKTRLAEKLAADASAIGVPVVWGRCSADSGVPPLWPLRRIAEQLPGHVQLPTADGDGYGSSAEGSAAARFALFVWFTDIVLAAASPAGLLVIVEDVHWADSATTGALGHLAAELGRSRALVVVTARPRVASDADPLAALLERPAVEQRKMSGLDRKDIIDYLRGVDGGPVDERYADLVLRQTAGNSLYVAAVARLLSERGSLASYDESGSRSALAGHPELLDLIREPLGRVSANCLGVVEAASVAGEEFDIVELSRALELPGDTIMASVDEAVRAGLLVRPTDAPGEVRFVHALVRDGVYDNVDRAARARVHRALATAIAQTDIGDERIAAIASHLARGAATPADHVRAAAAARRAGQAALADLAFDEAAGQFGSALYSLVMAGGPAPTDRAEILLDLAFAEYRSGSFGGSVEHCALAADLAESTQRWDLLARAALLVDGVALSEAGDSLSSLCHRALARTPEGELSVRAQLEARLAYATAERGDLGNAAKMSAQALALAELTADPPALLAALRARHQALSGPGNAAERLHLGTRALELADRGEPMAALWGRLWRIDAAFELGNLVAVDQELSALARLADRLKFPLARWHLLRLQAAREASVGRFDAAEEQAESARDLSGELEDPSVVGLYLAFRMSLGYTRGDLVPHHASAEEVGQCIAEALAVQMPIADASAATGMIRAGDPDEAGRLARRLTLETGGLPMDGRWLVTIAMLADVVADVHDIDSAAALYPLLEPFSTLAVAGGSGTVSCEGSVSRHLGRLAFTCGRLDVAQRHFRDAITVEERMGGRPFVALSRMFLARVLHSQGGAQNLAAAAQAARTALAAMRAIGMPGWTAQCEQALAGIDADLTDRSALTRREQEIVGLVAEGHSNRQIADQLFVSERTVETHVSHVLAKLGVTTRTDIATWAVAGGLIAERS